MKFQLTILLLFLCLSPAGQATHLTKAAQQRIQDLETDDDEAPVIHCGRVIIHGSEQLTSVEMCRLVGDLAGNFPDPEAQETVGSRLIEEYRRRGFLDAALTWSQPDRTETSSWDVKLVINDGPRYTLRRLEMVGNENTRDRVIRKRVALNEGTPFDEDLLELSIKRINQLGIFEEFKREDVQVKVNKKGHVVDLTFNLQEK